MLHHTGNKRGVGVYKVIDVQKIRANDFFFECKNFLHIHAYVYVCLCMYYLSRFHLTHFLGK